MWLLGVALFVASATAQFRPPDFQACDGVRLNSVQASFNDVLGINPSLGVKTFDALRQAVENIWASQGALGLQTVCSAFKLIKVGFDNIQGYEACFFGPAGLVSTANGTSTGITMAQAIGYQKLMNQFDFACGAGFSVFANVDACAAGIFATNSSRTRLNNCQSDFLNSVANDPSDACSYADIAATCYRNTFFPCGVTAAWWGCEYERMGTATYYPQCTQNFCNFNP
ncbi:unnamed protein product, partial [Mesorhabditis spiculigera]